jgi:hypothetical protein
MNNTAVASMLVLLSVSGFSVASAQASSRIDRTDFVVTDSAGNQMTIQERTADDVLVPTNDEGEQIETRIIGEIGTFWSADHHLAYVRSVGGEQELVYKNAVVARTSGTFEQLGDITSALAYCETTNESGETEYIAYVHKKKYTFKELICTASTLSGDTLISYAKQVYVNGVDSGRGATGSGRVLDAFLYKRSLVYIPTISNPYETRLMVENTELTSAPGVQGSLLDATVQGGKLVYSEYKEGAGWTVIWGGEVVSRYHAYVTGFLKYAKKLTYSAMTPRGVVLFRGNKVYGVGYNTIRFMQETSKGNIVYVTSKTTSEEDQSKRRIMQDALWFNGTKLVQSLYAQNYFAKTILINNIYPLVVVETLSNQPQYIWYQGRIGLRGQKIVTAAEDGARIALLTEHTDGTREIVYIEKEQ